MSIGANRIGYFWDYDFVEPPKKNKKFDRSRKKIIIDPSKLRELLAKQPLSQSEFSRMVYGTKYNIINACLNRLFFYEEDYLKAKKHLGGDFKAEGQ